MIQLQTKVTATSGEMLVLNTFAKECEKVNKMFREGFSSCLKWFRGDRSAFKFILKSGNAKETVWIVANQNFKGHDPLLFSSKLYLNKGHKTLFLNFIRLFLQKKCFIDGFVVNLSTIS